MCVLSSVAIVHVIVTNKTTNFQSLEVVDRGSETQPQVTENYNI